MNTDLELLNFAEDIHTSNVEWLWKPYIPYGKITIIQGDPGCGKTMFATYLIANISNGKAFDEEERINIPLVSLYQTGEDGLGDTIKPRLENLGANCKMVYSINEYKQSLSMNDIRIEEAIQNTNAKVIILDPIQAYLGAKVDMHRANEVRPILKHLGDVAERYNCAVILIGHMNKSATKAQYRGIGSIDFLACARSVLTMGCLNDDKNIRVLVQTKNSLDVTGSPIAFRTSDDDCFEYIGEYNIDIDDLLSGGSGNTKLEEAKAIIKQCLLDGNNESTHIIAKTKAVGIGERTTKQAKKQLQMKSKKKGDKWYWIY
ncbi:AAA family ATPase [Thomasclavelia sp.]